MTPLENRVSERIRSAIRADRGCLLQARYRGSSCPYAGYCYLAAEAFFHSMPKGYKPMFLRWEDAPHWFIQAPDGRVIDLTSEQFKTMPDYAQAKGKGFLTDRPSRRCSQLLLRVEAP